MKGQKADKVITDEPEPDIVNEKSPKEKLKKRNHFAVEICIDLRVVGNRHGSEFLNEEGVLSR